jgi:hypothetical protein
MLSQQRLDAVGTAPAPMRTPLTTLARCALQAWLKEPWKGATALFPNVGQHPGQGQSARRGVSPSGPRPAARCDHGGQATSFDRALREPPRSRGALGSAAVAYPVDSFRPLPTHRTCAPDPRFRSFFRFVSFDEPAHSALIQRVLAIPSKRHDGGQTQVTRLRAGAALYLEIG